MTENIQTEPFYKISDTKNIHLLTERQSSTFNVEELTQHLFGGPENYFDINKRREIIRSSIAHPIHGTHLPLEYLDAEEHYSILLRKSLAAIEEANRLNITDSKHRTWFLLNFTHGRFVFYVHTCMCLHALETMSNEEQKQKFLPLAESYRMMLSYAQTELGHGTDLRSLETEAVFDQATDSFILNTPTMTSTKFWPGGLGKTANYVLLMAQLYTPDRDHPCGLQMFLVPIRDLDTHEPLPGVEVGEISARFAHITGDNGYLRLTNVHIPRTHMLMKLAQVDDQGNFNSQTDSRLLYGSLVYMRVYLCSSFSVYLAQTITIAMRYSAVRFQGLNSTESETRILDYPLQQDKLVPCLSTAYAFLISFIKLDSYFNQLKANPKSFVRQLPELHALSSSLKAYTSMVSERLAHICRIACGGHGFLFASGIVEKKAYLDASSNLEGDNTVLFQQTARYLLKSAQQVQNNADPSIDYLSSPIHSFTDLTNLEDYCHLFENRSQLLIKEVCKQILKSSLSPHQTFLNHSIQLVRVAKAHIEVFILRAFYEKVKKAAEHASISVIMEELFLVFAIHTLRNESIDFIRFKLLSANQISQLEMNTLTDLYNRLRPNLVSLVDAFDFHDFELDSCLGRYDGQVYESLMERARLNPSNQHPVPPVWVSIKQEAMSKLDN